MATYQPGDTGAEWTDEVWPRLIQPAVYEAMVFANKIKEYQKLDNKLHIRKAKTLGRNNLANTASGTSLTYSANTEVDVEITPIATYVAVQLSRSQMAQMNVDPQNVVVTGVQDSLAEGVDSACLADVGSLTTNFVGNAGSNIDRALLLNAMRLVRTNAKMEAVPGRSNLFLVLHPAQYDDLMSIDQLTGADVRGDDSNPNVNGMVFKALGLDVTLSGNVFVDTMAHNPLFVPSAFGVSYNEPIGVKRQEIELANRVIGYVNYGHGIVWDERACDIRTAAS